MVGLSSVLGHDLRLFGGERAQGCERANVLYAKRVPSDGLPESQGNR
jgi:hypothetical protein